jgi:hypothetical protein
MLNTFKYVFNYDNPETKDTELLSLLDKAISKFSKELKIE